jgi:hypothetical protein
MRNLKLKKVIGLLLTLSFLLSLSQSVLASTESTREVWLEKKASSITLIVRGNSAMISYEQSGILNGLFRTWAFLDDSSGKYVSSSVTCIDPMLAYTNGSKIAHIGIVSSTLINDSHNIQVVYQIAMDGGTVIQNDDNWYNVTVIY